MRACRLGMSRAASTANAALAHAWVMPEHLPERQVVALVGEGDHLQEHHARTDHVGADDLPEDPESSAALQPIDFVKLAQACGGTGFHVEEPGQVAHALDQALTAPGPVVIEAVVDPYEPPTPARMTSQQTLRLTQALARGEPHRGKIADTLFRDRISDVLLPEGKGRGPVATVKEKVRELVPDEE